MSKSRLYEGDISATWTIHRIVRDLLSAFSPICPFFTHYLSTTLYDSSSVDVRAFPRLPSFPGSELFEELRDKTESLEEFNSMVWRAKKDSGLSLRSAISDVKIPESLNLFSDFGKDAQSRVLVGQLRELWHLPVSKYSMSSHTISVPIEPVPPNRRCNMWAAMEGVVT